jgi:peptidoglycan hydrolase-like protein with peptidoglycan-binding domain
MGIEKHFSIRTEQLELPVPSGKPKKTARDIVLCAMGWVAIAMSAMTACPARSYAAEAVSGVEEIEITPSLVREIQFMLLRIGIDPGPIDGVVGPQTTGAFRRFQERADLPVRELVNGGRVSMGVLTRLRGEASRVIFESDKKPEPASAPAKLPTAALPSAPPPAEKPDRFAACAFNPEDLRIGATQYTPDKYLQVGFDGSTARAVSMLKDRLNEARQIAGNIGGSALTEVQRQSRVLDYFSCRLKIEQGSDR